MEEELEKLREKLNLLVIKEDAILHSAEILRLSQELDKLIYKYYKKLRETEQFKSKNNFTLFPSK